VATIKITAHGFANGQPVNVSGLGGAGYNSVPGSSAVITVTDADHFTYPNPGANEGVTADANGTVTPLAFEKVELFDSEDLTEAFKFLTLVEQRVCLIVPLDEEFNASPGEGNGQAALKYLWRRMLPVIVICSDRVLGDRKASLFGIEPPDANATPGAFGLADLVLPAVSGLLLGNPNGVVCEPKMTSVLTVKDMEKKLPGRVAVGIEFECRGGRLETTLPKGPIF
jgi:hypothetical protein